jgi:prolyl-tRNA synthetase
MVSPAAPPSEARAGLFSANERHWVDITVFGDSELKGDDPHVLGALEGVFGLCDVPVSWAETGVGDRQAFYAHPNGDSEVVHCPECGHAAERSWAATDWPEAPDEPEGEPEEVSTPGCDTIAALADFLGIPASKTLKMVFYSVEGKVTCIVVRGDRKVDEAKLARVLGTSWYYTSLDNELADAGAVGGYASPIGLDPNLVRVVADPSVRSGKNFVSGANRPDFHIQNVNIPRDFDPGEWANLALIEAGDPCSQCGGRLEIDPGFSLARSTAPRPCEPSAEYLDQTGKARPLWTAGWSMDLTRLMAATVEQHNDDYGIAWPVGCAPYDVHLVALDLRKEGVAERADDLYEKLQADGLAVLYDDRDASAGVKFNDADLIGVPLRLTVGKRLVKEGIIEVKWRHGTERLRLDAEGLVAELARTRA